MNREETMIVCIPVAEPPNLLNDDSAPKERKVAKWKWVNFRSPFCHSGKQPEYHAVRPSEKTMEHPHGFFSDSTSSEAIRSLNSTLGQRNAL